MIELQYFNGKEWVTVEIFYNERIAWINLFIPDTKFRIYNYMLVVYAKLDSGYSNILFYL
jgi:hypothetical protein